MSVCGQVDILPSYNIPQFVEVELTRSKIY